MKRTMKVFVSVLILISLVLPGGVFAQDEGIFVAINGQLVEFDAKPVLEGERVLVPIRGVFEQIGGVVTWDEDKNKVLVEKDELTIELTVGDNIAKLHRKYDFTGIPEEVVLDSAAKIIGDRTYAPVRFVAETLGMEVAWDNDSQTVLINLPELNPIEMPVKYQIISFDDIKDNEELDKWYNDNYKIKGIHTANNNNSTYILICAGEKPTGGYGIEVNSVTMVSTGSVQVMAMVSAPAPGLMVTQALTYPNALLKIEGQNIDSVGGNILGEDTKTLKEQGNGINFEDIMSITLFSLDGNVVEQLNDDRFEEIGTYLNEGIISDDPYIMMLAGKTMRIALENGSVNITSYGSKTNIVADIRIGDNASSYHLICPEIARILLDTDEVSDKTMLEQGKGISAKEITAVEFFDLEGNKTDEYSADKFESIADYFNNSTITNDPYLLMLVHKVMKVSLSNGGVIEFSSSGSRANVVAKVQEGDSAVSYHIRCPEIARILLDIDESEITLKEQRKGIDAENVKAIELFDIFGEKTEEINSDRFEEICLFFNNSKVSDKAYIEMLTGKTMKIVLENGFVSITSYGSKTNIVANIQIGERSESYHLICPEIASILLDLEENELALLDEGIKIDAEEIKAIELFDLKGGKVEDIDADRYAKIGEYLNNSKISDHPYVKMIAGKTMKITLNNGVINLSSYGSKTNIIAGIQIGERSESYHLICPEIASILLS